MHHSWQAFVVKSSIQTVERAGLLNQLSGRSNDVANQSGIISVVGKYNFIITLLLTYFSDEQVYIMIITDMEKMIHQEINNKQYYALNPLLSP